MPQGHGPGYLAAKAGSFELRLTKAVRDQFDLATMRGTDTNMAAAYHASTIRHYTNQGGAK